MHSVTALLYWVAHLHGPRLRGGGLPGFTSLEEPSDAAFYGGGKPRPPHGWPIVRLKNPTVAEFNRYIVAGIPIVVEEASRDLPQRNWTCHTMKTLFGDQNMHKAVRQSSFERLVIG